MSMIELVMHLMLRFKRLLERKKKNDEAESAYSEEMSLEYRYLAFPNREFLI